MVNWFKMKIFYHNTMVEWTFIKTNKKHNRLKRGRKAIKKGWPEKANPFFVVAPTGLEPVFTV